jgi:hypothetical protein
MQQPSVSLNLSNCKFDQDATNLLQSFLQNCPNPVRLLIHVEGMELHEMDSTWLSRLIGPAVHTLTLNNGVKEVFQDFMKSLQTKQQLIYLEFRDIYSLDAYQVIVDGIPDISYVEEFRICFYRNDRNPSNEELASIKTTFLRKLAKNLSITTVYLQLENFSSSSIWTEQEQETL